MRTVIFDRLQASEGLPGTQAPRRSSISSAVALIALGALGTATTSIAQENPSASAASAQDQDAGEVLFEEIVVTARRREENAQDVPIAMTAISPDAIRDNNVATLQDVQYLAPSLTVSTGNVGQRDSANVTIRGQGWSSFGQPAVAQYLNEVPLPTDINSVLAGGPGLYFDLENIQVLKGPQGTLFGRNTMGGAVLLQTARPRHEFGGRVQVGVGNYSNREIDGAINLPIVEDKLLARVAFNGQVRDGFTHLQSMPGHSNGIDLDNRDTRSVRASVSFHPTTSVRNDTIVTYQEYTSHGTGSFLTDVDPNGLALSVYGNVLLDLLAQQQALGARTHLPLGINVDGSGGRLLAAENITEFDLSDRLTVRNILGYRDAVFKYESALFGTRLPIFEDIHDRYDARQFSDELQLLGKAFDGRLNWVAGAFYADQGPPDENFFPVLTLRALLPDGTPPDEANVLVPRQQMLTSKAIFAQGTYDLSNVVSGLKLTLGARHTWDDRTDRNRQPNGEITSQGSPSEAPTWTAAIEYEAGPGTLLYLTSRRGYRAGGASAGSDGEIRMFDPEYVADLEVGVKSDWQVADVPVRTNVAVYHQDYSDIQVNQLITDADVPGGFVNITNNAGTARLWGAEVEAQANLTRNFQIGVNFAYLNFKYTDFAPGVDEQALRAGETANRIPRSYGVNARYGLPLPETLGDVSLRANWHWQDAFGDFLGTKEIPAYGLLNLSLNWEGINGAPLDAQIFCSNALDKTYVSGGIGFFGVTESTYGEPRMYGIRFAHRFGASER